MKKVKRFYSFVRKETLHIFRDRRTLLILFGMPLVMMLLFGFAITTDVKNVRVAAVTSNYDHLTQQTLDRLNASEYFTVTQRVSTPAEAGRLIRDQQADMAIVFSPGFANHPTSRSIQFIVDGTDPNTALTRQSYAQQVLNEELRMKNEEWANANGSPAGNSSFFILHSTFTRMLYNPQMKSAYNFVPGIMGMLLMLICAMMTSISIAREKERGTMEVVLVSPVRPLMIIIAKAVPYFLLSLLVLAVILLMSRYVLLVPVEGNLLAVVLVSMLYIFLALSLGLLISVMVDTQLVAMLMSALVLLMPCILLSGMMYPIESMPVALQWVSAVMPARWYIAAIRKLMVMGVSWQMAAHEILVMLLMTVVILTVALKKFKTRLE